MLPVKDIILLLEFCLKNTYFSLQGQFYEQVEGVAMRSPVSTMVANLYMEYFEQKALTTATHLPRMWLRNVNDTFVIQKEDHKQNFLQHINCVDLAIKFTVEDNKEDGAIPFLDTTVKPEANGRLSIIVYRKPTHMDQYLQWDSHHHLSAKYSVVNTLTYRAKTVCNKPELLQKKWSISGKQSLCKYPKWAFDRVERRLTQPTSEVSNEANNQATTHTQLTTNEVKTKGHIVIPYTQGLWENIKKICSRYGIQIHFKGNSTIKNLLVFPMDKDPMENKGQPSTGSNVGTLYVIGNI